MIDRRSLIVALGASVAAALTGGARAGAGLPALYAGCRVDGRGRASLALFDETGRSVFATDLPARGHDVAVAPDGRRLVVFARRPGTWAAVVEIGTGRVERTILAAPGRHFYGHGAFSADGRLLIATENAFEAGEGLLGLYDVQGGFRRIGEVPSHGVGPHDVVRLPDGRLAVANGGIRTHPETGREMLNLSTMRPNLAWIDPSGGLREAVELPPSHRLASLRHLAVGAGGTIAFGCQFEGDPSEAPDLVGIVGAGGRPVLLPIPEEANARFDNYIGSLAFDRSGAILAATSPRGGVTGVWDVPGRRFLGLTAMPDVCGIAAAAGPGLFVLTSGQDGVRIGAPDRGGLDRLGGSDLQAWIWDNHLERIDPAA